MPAAFPARRCTAKARPHSCSIRSARLHTSSTSWSYKRQHWERKWPALRPWAREHAQRQCRSSAPSASQPADDDATPSAAAQQDATDGEDAAATDADDVAQEPAIHAVALAAEVEEEDDLSPLLSALEKAEGRAERLTKARQANENEALEVAELAIAERDKLARARKDVADTEHMLHKREKQVAQMLKQREALEVEMSRAQESDALASVDAPLDSGPASTDHWDEITELKAKANGGGDFEADMSENEKTLAEVKAACMIIDERINAYTESLTALQTKLEGLNERVLQAEKAYTEADAGAAAAMRRTEAIVTDELEAKAVYSRVKEAVEAAERSLAAIHAGEEDVAEADAKAKDSGSEEEGEVKSYTEMTQEELEKLEMDSSLEEVAPAEAPSPEQNAPPWLKVLAIGVTVAVLGYGVAQTKFGAWLANEWAVTSTLIQKVSAVATRILESIPWPSPEHGAESIWETLTILFASVLAVPMVLKFVPGGSAILGFLIAGAVIGPFGMGLIMDTEPVKHLAEIGVIFLLFNLGLELSLERLIALARQVFVLGTLQFTLSTCAIASAAILLAGYSGPAAIIVGGALALSSTAVVMKIMQERSETGSRHGRATFAILLFQDLAVVVLLMLVPLLAQGGSGGMLLIAKALGVAAVKALVCVTGIIIAGRTLLRPVFRRINQLDNDEIFAATTLLVVLGSSVLTQIAGLSQALGAFLAGLLMAETEYALQVESDIKPFKGLLMGLFFMSVGMDMQFAVFFANWPTVLGSLLALVFGKLGIMMLIGKPSGLTPLAAARSGLYIAPGGEFAFVVFSEAVEKGLLTASQVAPIVFMVVLSMAITPYLGDAGRELSKVFEAKDQSAAVPTDTETSELNNHVIILGFGRVGQTIAQLLSERLIPFVALDVRGDRVAAGQAADLPVYFGDAGAPQVLSHLNASRARCAVITLDTPGANYRAVWAMNKHYPNAKIYVRAHDVTHGINLEKAGATAVVPEILEPSLQLSAAVLGSLNLSAEEINEVIDSFRRNHMRELRQLSEMSGGSLGYGLSTRDDETMEAVPVDAVAVDADLEGVIKALPEPNKAPVVNPAAVPGPA